MASRRGTRDDKRPQAIGDQPPFFEWIKEAFHNRRTLKTWIRCCIALLVTLILMVNTKTSLNMGQAAFFIVIVSIMLPPSLATSVFILALTTLLLGMLIGWAWGCAAMASSLSVRSQALLAQQQQKLQSSIVPGVPVAAQTQKMVLSGIFLDPRSSAVYGAFFFIGNFALGTLRAYLPNLTLLSIFGTIVLDVMCTTGPSFPTAQYTLPKSFILPASYYAAVALACLVLIFPESLSHLWLTSLKNDFWMPTLELLRLQTHALQSKPSDHVAWSELTVRGQALRSRVVLGTDDLLSQIGLINLDTSIGRLGPSDLKRINDQLKGLMFRAGGLQSFQTFVNDTNEQDEKLENLANEKVASASPPTLQRYTSLRRRIQESELQHGHDLDSLVPILDNASSNLRQACEVGVENVIDWLQECNGRRWVTFFSPPKKHQIEERHAKLTEQLQRLRDALTEFRDVERVRMVKPFEKFFDPVTKRLLVSSNDSKTRFASRSLFVCFVFLDTLDAFADGLVNMLALITELDSARPKAKFWFPGRLGHLKNTIQSDEFKGSAGPFSMGTAEDPTRFSSNSSSLDVDSHDEEDVSVKSGSDEDTPLPRRRDPDAFPPSTKIGKGLARLGPFFRFFKSPEGIFAFRIAILSIALWMPSVFHSTAWFYYNNKGLWALIMAQTALAIYAGDQIAGLFIRLLGTIIGLLIGMAVWYIGAGRGPGNPYGIVAATTVILSPFVLARIAAPKEQLALWTMIPITIVFVAGYSWVNANHPALGNPGVGVELGWKRALLVIIGFGAAFVVMLFPNPISSRVLVRKTLAAVGGEIGNIYASEVEAFLAEEGRARGGEFEKPEFQGDKEKDDNKVSAKERRVRKIARRVLAVARRMREVEPSLTTANWEPQVAGTWPHEQYKLLFALEVRALGSLVLLITAFSKLDTKWCRILIYRTPFLNPNFLSDLFTTIAIISSSLMSGQPVPAYLPKLRDRLVYHEYHTLKPTLDARSSAPKDAITSDGDSEDSVVDDDRPTQGRTRGEFEDTISKVDGVSIGLEEITLDTLMDEQLPAHSSAVVAIASLITRIDEMADITRTLCGESTSLRGYESLHRDYLDREEQRVGGAFCATDAN